MQVPRHISEKKSNVSRFVPMKLIAVLVQSDLKPRISVKDLWSCWVIHHAVCYVSLSTFHTSSPVLTLIPGHTQSRRKPTVTTITIFVELVISLNIT